MIVNPWQQFTNELAVMCDTFRPLRLTPLWAGIDGGRYALSWASDVAQVGTSD